jgi:pyridoxamine 5'-phosphate oxidase
VDVTRHPQGDGPAPADEAGVGEAGVGEAGAGEAGLDESMLASDPLAQFASWMADAVAQPLPEPTAMVLATVSASGQPRARTVLLKSYDSGGFTFYTNRFSRKGTDLAEVPRACLLFPWHAMLRQVIIEGPVTALSTEQSEPYFRSRPRGSQLAAWASRQSSVIPSRRELEDRYAALAARWPEGTPVPMPEFWGGYQVVPESFEFWHGRASRMHDRLRYRRQDGRWLIERLAP